MLEHGGPRRDSEFGCSHRLGTAGWRGNYRTAVGGRLAAGDRLAAGPDT